MYRSDRHSSERHMFKIQNPAWRQYKIIATRDQHGLKTTRRPCEICASNHDLSHPSPPHPSHFSSTSQSSFHLMKPKELTWVPYHGRSYDKIYSLILVSRIEKSTSIERAVIFDRWGNALRMYSATLKQYTNR